MALKSKLSAEEHAALPDVLKEHYVQRGHDFVLEAEGLVDRSALDNERKEKAAAARQFAELKAQIGDLDPAKAREALKKVQELQNKDLLDAGKVEELIEARTAAMRADHDNQVKAFKKREEELLKSNNDLTGTLKKTTIDSAIRATAIELGVKPENLDDVVARMTITGAGLDGIRWDLRDGKPVALKDDQIQYGKDATEPMSFKEGVALLATRVPGFFQASTGSGAQGSRGGGGTSGFTISEQDAQDPAKYRQVRERAEKAGQTVTIQ